MAMRTSATLISFAIFAAHLACSNAEFSPEPGQDGSTTADVAPPERPPDVTPYALVCESPGVAVCLPSACTSVCHTPEASAGAGMACTVFSGTDPARYDDCATSNVCLTDGFGTSSCFALCRNAVDCPGGRACTPRMLAGATTIRVCDPPYQNCASASEPCCDPLASQSCGPGRYCYLLPPQAGSEDSWTVCEYETGGSLRGQSCATSRDCLPGLACFFETPSSPGGECRQVCNPTDANACPTGTCLPYGKQWGLCSE